MDPPVPKQLPDDIRADLDRACALHDRAVADYDKCLEFNKLLSNLLVRLEDEGYDSTAGKVMTLLLQCNPKAGTKCDKSTLVGEKIKKI